MGHLAVEGRKQEAEQYGITSCEVRFHGEKCETKEVFPWYAIESRARAWMVTPHVERSMLEMSSSSSLHLDGKM
jgi:hypothetical protein